MKRAIVIVMDGCGAGVAPDAAEFGDLDQPSTIFHVWQRNPSLQVPTLESLGFMAACGVPGTPGNAAAWGRLQPLSKGGKDSVTGHWEMMGITLEKPFPTYPNGFPADLVHAFEQRIGRQVLGNRPASGTAILAELGPEHMATGSPILYTSADSVFQVAAHESIIAINELYEMCWVAREICQEPNLVQRIIARPFEGDATTGFRRTERRRDFPAPPPPNLADEIGDVYGVGVVSELFGGRGFRQTPRTQSNAEHERALDEALASDARFIFANFEDFDMLYGHRNDPVGFGQCLEAFDGTLANILAKLTDDDLLILTADHGNDPTSPSTDHSREYVPFVALGSPESGPLGDLKGFSQVGAWVRRHLEI